MKDMNWLTNNIPWLFSGLGIVLFSGITLHSWFGVANLLESRTNLTKIRMLILNTDDANLLKAYEDMRGFPLDEPSSRLLKRFLGVSNAEIRVIDSLTPVMFVSTDMDRTYGYIKAEHFFNDRRKNKNSEFPNIELTPDDDDWYNIYRNQIEVIWDRAKPWKG